jgi:hypothetical protein
MMGAIIVYAQVTPNTYDLVYFLIFKKLVKVGSHPPKVEWHEVVWVVRAAVPKKIRSNDAIALPSEIVDLEMPAV